MENEVDKGGRPPHEPTKEARDRVHLLSKYGIPTNQIASELKITDDTLRKYYHEELHNGKAEMNLAVSKRAYYKATVEGDPAMIKWWTATQLKWKAEEDHNIKGDINVQISDQDRKIVEMLLDATNAKSDK